MHTKTAAFTQTEQLPRTFSGHNGTGVVANSSASYSEQRPLVVPMTVTRRPLLTVGW